MCPFITLWLSTLKMIGISLSKIKCKFDITLVCVFLLDCRVGHFLTLHVFSLLALTSLFACVCYVGHLVPEPQDHAFLPYIWIPHAPYQYLGIYEARTSPLFFFYLCFLIFPLSTHDPLVCLFISIDSYICHPCLELLNLSSVALFGC